jgi:hypothetical protein
LRRREVEPDGVEPDMRATHVERVAVQQRAHRGDRLLQQPEAVWRASADLAHPGVHAVAERSREPAGMHPREPGELHRDDRRIADRGGQEPHADAEPLGHGERRRRQREPAGEEAVLGEPQLVEPMALGRAREGGQPLRRPLRSEHHPHPRHRENRTVTFGRCRLSMDRTPTDMT